MKVLVVGSGAREHALVWKFSQSRQISGLHVLPGNAGTSEIAENIEGIDPLDADSVVRVCREKSIDLLFIGPEAPLAAGVADEAEAAGIPVVGPRKAAAQLESSKVFSKSFMNKHNIPTAGAEEVESVDRFRKVIESGTGKRVIKKNGLAAGKGVLESSDREELLSFGETILKTDTLLVEDYLEGYEISVFTLFDGQHYRLFPPCADFKKAGENDTGPNTGGMGAICPVPGLPSSLLPEIEEKIIKPTFDGIKSDGLPYIGFLYFGLMITEDGPRLLEYNARLGDPEAQVLLPLIENDFGAMMEAVAEQKLGSMTIRMSHNSAVGVVAASGGYPGEYAKGVPVRRLPENVNKKVAVFHASTAKSPDGTAVTGGGRCFTVVGMDQELEEAQRIAYSRMDSVQFDGMWYRKDIGDKFLF